MEPVQTLISDSDSPTPDFSSTVDTSRAFSSVKEAVAIFGERLLVGEIYPPKPFIDSTAATPKREPSWRFSSPSPMHPKESNGNAVFDTLKKLEAELQETKVELKLLKERESETEVALATLNAELHKNMSKLAEAEAAAAAGKAAAATKTTVRVEREIRGGDDKKEEGTKEEEKKKRELIRRMEESQTLAHILSLGENESYFAKKKDGKMMKKKPIIPLVGDLFFRKKGSAANHHHNPLYASPFFYN